MSHTTARLRHGASRARRLVAGLRRRAPVCESVQDWATEHQGTACRVLAPPRRFTRQPPRTVEPTVHPQYTSRLVGDQRGRYLVPIRGARLIGPRGLVMLPDGSFSTEASYGRDGLDEDPEYATRHPRPAVVKPGSYFSLIVRWSSTGNYYHWFHDTLTRLHGVLEWLPPDTTFIVPADLAPFQRQSLRLVGIADDRTVPFAGDEVWELETLHFAPPTSNSGSDRCDADLWLRDRIMAGCGITHTGARRRILVSRQHAPTRRLVNANEVEVFLRAYGFETCVAESMTLAEQVALFAQAEVVVGPHGAGFTNMLFAPPGLKVVDLIDPNRLSHAYVFWSMAEEIGHEYWYLVADPVPGTTGEDDTSVPLDKLAATIERMGLGPRRSGV